MENSLLWQATMDEAYARIKELEEENKKLNEQIEQFKKWVKAWTNIIERLEEENRKLKAHSNMLESENILLKKECKARLERIKELEK